MAVGLTRSGWRDPDFWIEIGCLALAAPSLYFPGRFGKWMLAAALVSLAAGWVWRRRRLGYWLQRTAIDWPLVLFALMTTVAVGVAPPQLRMEYSLPRALILLWNVCLFWVVAIHADRSAGIRQACAAGFIIAGVAIAVAGLVGTQWAAKIPALTPVASRLPHLLGGAFAGAEEGFSPNQLAGSLLYVLPFGLALFVSELCHRRRPMLLVVGSIAACVMTGVLLLSQSRAGYVGLGVSLLVLALGPSRWGRLLLYGGCLAAVLGFLTLPLGFLLRQLDAATGTYAAEGGVNMAARLEIWTRAVYAISDFPYTGMGLGTFRKIGPILYPLFSIPKSYDIAHAHNFFLQTALDLGLPGLVAFLAIYLLAVTQGASIWRLAPFPGSRAWSLGLVASLIGQATYSLADAVALGAKTNFLFWFLLALVFGVTVHRRTQMAPNAR